MNLECEEKILHNYSSQISNIFLRNGCPKFLDCLLKRSVILFSENETKIH